MSGGLLPATQAPAGVTSSREPVLSQTRWNADQLESVACDVCGEAAPAPVHVITRPDGLRVVECPACGLAWINPRPRPEFVSALYDIGYFTGTRSADGIGYEAYCGADSRRSRESYPVMVARTRLDVIAETVTLRGRTLLEVGCATGEFCAEAHEAGAVVTGIDISDDVVRVAAERHPALSFLVSSAEDLVRSGRSFEVVCAFEVIEHVLSPSAFMRALHRLCSSGGTVVLSTPNYDQAKVVGAERWLGFQTSLEHLYFLSPGSLGRLAREAGFELVDWYASGEGIYGASDPAQRPWRTLVRAVLSRLRVLEVVRRLRRRARGHGYARRTPGHSLLAFLR